MPRLIAAAILAALFLATATRADAGMVVTVDKSEQMLTVAIDGVTRYRWPVSTARWGYRTPNGSYRPQRLERQWFSRKYDMSPMPYSIFFNGGYAIHGSYEIRRLGRPASHGCIRLHPENAATLFALVRANRAATRIVVTGARLEPAPPVHQVVRSGRQPMPNIGRSRAQPGRGTVEDRRPQATFERIFGSRY